MNRGSTTPTKKRGMAMEIEQLNENTALSSLPLEESTPPAEAEKLSEEASPTLVSPDEEIASLKAELEQLRATLAQKEEEQKRVTSEMEEFNRLFPTTSVREIPESVWKEVGMGIPLSAAYALYEKKNRMDRIHAEEINRLNAERSAGRAGLHTQNEYFSPDEVRAMSPSEVRENFKKIRESMKKWS